MIYWCEDREFVEREFNRMGFNQNARWRISDINKNFNLCSTYPRFLILPTNFKDEDLEEVAKFRYFRRIPVAVWRYIKNGCFIMRTSQPTVGWFGWFRSPLDEGLIQSYVNNTIPPSDNNLPRTVDHNDSIDEPEVKDNSNCNTNGKSDSKLNDEGNENGKGIKNGNCGEINDGNGNGRIKGNQNNGNVSEQPNGNSLHGQVAYGNLDAKNDRVQGSCDDIDERKDHCYYNSLTSSGESASIKQPSSFTKANNTSSSTTSSSQLNEVSSTIIVIDARSYTAALANRTKGGGCECSEYYQGCEVQFMNLANIHSIRKSYQAIRNACEVYSELSNNWVTFLDNSRWLHHLSGLIRSASLIVDAIDIDQKSVLIHCSDGWDRTPQLVALAEIMLDPYYRTFDGFKILIQREWLDFGHKFADRCGSNPCNDDPNERCPVFLQWLDCVQQLLVQYPSEFEFNSAYLDKLNRHTYSNIFATFSHNSPQDRFLSRVDDKLSSLWDYFDCTRNRYRNSDYLASDLILRPSNRVKDLYFWKQVYMPPVKHQNPQSYSIEGNDIDGRKFYDSLYDKWTFDGRL